MNVTLKLNLGEYQLVELRRLAADKGVDIADIVAGITTLYLKGQGPFPKPRKDSRRERLVTDILAAVNAFQEPPAGGYVKALSAGEYTGESKPLGTFGSKGGRIGRPPKMTDDEVRAAAELRKSGMFWKDIAFKLGHSDYVVRDTLTRSTRGRA